MVSGRVDYSAHRHRIAGFRSVLAQRAPHLSLSEALAGEDSPETLRRLLEQNLARNRHIVGIYNTGDVNKEVSEALARHSWQERSGIEGVQGHGLVARRARQRTSSRYLAQGLIACGPGQPWIFPAGIRSGRWCPAGAVRRKAVVDGARRCDGRDRVRFRYG